MAPSLRLAILVTVFYACSDASLLAFSHGAIKDGFMRDVVYEKFSQEKLDSSQKEWFDQKLDHFDSADTRRWKQKFFTDGSSKRKHLFVGIGAESALGPSFKDSAMSYYAKMYNASCVALEHRFYGDSHPTPDLSVKNLRYLSSEQALSDLAAFITAKKEEFSAEKVVVFGGSYGGNLAAWFRLKYPHLAQGAVASSAPILAQVDFKELFEVQAEPLKNYKTGNVCTIAIAAAVKKSQQLLESAEGRDKMKKLFNFCDDMDMADWKDMSIFYRSSAFMMTFMGADHTCGRMTNTSIGEPVERYASMFNRGLCTSYIYKDVVTNYLNESYGYQTGRQWTYQTCAEFGYFQSSDSNKQPFGGFPVDFDLQLCEDVYGPDFSAENTKRAIGDTNINYGGLDYSENHVVFVNGGIDPWHRLSIIHSLPNAPAIFLPDGGHCSDMHTPGPDDPPALVKAHKEIGQLIGQWLE